MKCLLVLIISCICISCYNKSDIVFIKKQLDKEIQLIKNKIVTETNAIQRAYANGVGKNTQDVCEELFLSSEKTNSLYLAIVDSSIDLYNKKEEIITCFSNHLELIITYLSNDAVPENDYLVATFRKELFNGMLKENESSHREFMFEALSNQNGDISVLQFKMIFFQLKNAECQMWQYFNKEIKGHGATMNEYRGFIGFDEKTILSGDTTQGTIFCDAYGKDNVMKYYLGKIDWAMFGKSKNLVYQAGEKTKIPIIGEYQTIQPEFRGKFFHTPKDAGFETIEGVIEINSAQATFYVPFKKTFQVFKKVPEYFLNE